MRKHSKPTIGRAIAKVRTDPNARFAALLAAAFAFSLGFAFGFTMGTREAEPAPGPSGQAPEADEPEPHRG